MATASDNLAAWADLYDAIYAARGKRYDREAARLVEIIRHAGGSAGGGAATRSMSLLDAACGTGEHLRHLRAGFAEVAGVDRCPGMLTVARAKLPGVTLHEADMASMRLGRRFDVVTCLFASIGYLRGEAAIRRAIATLAGHLRPGGLLVIEPPLTAAQLQPAARDRMTVRVNGRTVERVATAEHADGRLVIRFDFEISGPGGVETFSDEHSIGVFEHELFLDAFRDAGLAGRLEPAGLAGDGRTAVLVAQAPTTA